MRPLSAIAALCTCVALVFGQSDASDSLEKYRKELETNRSSSLAHYRIGEIFLKQKNYQPAANEFREALNGDLQPAWVETQSHMGLGAIFELSGQSDRALNEYQLATQAIIRNPANAPAAPPLPPLPTANQVGNVVVPPQLLQKTEPEYSEEARLAGLEGAVLVTATITEQGVARDMRVTGSLGFGLDEKALAAIQQWRYTPGTRQGQPVPVVMTVPVDFRLPDKQSRWHLIRAEFTPPERASRPQFSKTSYPYGVGISLNAFEEAIVIRAIGREATATVAFDVDEHGLPVNLQVLNASHPIWGPEAMAVVREWQFAPGMKYGAPVSVLCTVDLVWGPTNLSTQALQWAVAQMSVPSRPDPSHSVTSPPVVVYRGYDPSYTEEARTARLQGTVQVSFTVGEDGVPQNLRIISPLGHGLDEKAMESVSQWRFQPVILNGQPTRIGTTISVTFSLNDAQGRQRLDDGRTPGRRPASSQ
jgi:TonB family protein